jgi:hypothetical protein
MRPWKSLIAVFVLGTLGSIGCSDPPADEVTGPDDDTPGGSAGAGGRASSGPRAGASGGAAGAGGAAGTSMAPRPGDAGAGGGAAGAPGGGMTGGSSGGAGAPGGGDPGAGGAPGGMPGAGASGVLPVVMVDVMGGKFIGTGKFGDPKNKLMGRLRIIEDHDGKGDLAGIASRPASVDVRVQIGYRGGASLYFFPKKGYGFEIQDDKGEERAVSLLGMPAESDWVLQACYTDKSCLRNMLTYLLGAELGRDYFAPRVRYVELFVDGKYDGLYHLQEKIKRDKRRIDVPKVTDEDVTGGYIVKRDGNGDGPGTSWTSPGGNIWTFHYPKETRITAKQKAYIVGEVNAFEALMTSGNAFDPRVGYRSKIDVPSFIDYYLMQEFVKNADGYRRSTFLIKQPASRGGKFVMGPLWDFDLAFGNSGGDSRWFSNEWVRPDLWVHQIMKLSGAPENVPGWWYRLFQDPSFNDEARCRWHELRRGPIRFEAIDAKIRAILPQLTEARRRDQARWPTVGKKIWPNYWVGNNLEEEIEWLRRWIDHRIRFMDAQLPGKCASVPAPTNGAALPMPSILPPSGMAKTSPPLSPPAPPLPGAGASPSPSPSPAPSPAPMPMPMPAPTGAPSCKRGLAFGRHAPEDMQAIAKGISWYYNWSPRPEASIGDAYARAGVEFVPMVWGKSFDVEQVIAGIPAGAKYLLGFNEPNFANQANMTPEQAAELWPKLEEIARRKNLILVSPAINYCGNSCVVKDPFEWMDKFMAACRNCRIDHVAAHMYSCYGGGIKSMVDKMKKYGKPIWLTEFACDYDAQPTEANQMRVMRDGVKVLEDDPMVFRYAWFSGRTTRIPNVNVFGDAGKLTPLGEQYVTLPAAMTCAR